MKKISIICAIIVSILIFGGYTFEACAETQKVDSIVETLSASGTRHTVSVNGEFADNGALVYAVVVQVCDSAGNVIAMESGAVYDKSFLIEIKDVSLDAGATYEVYAADYAGGEWKKTEILVSIPKAPTGLEGVKPTVFGANDGKIIETTDAMEYSTATDSTSWTACTGTEINNLSAGTYYVRLKETADTYAGAYATVSIPEGDKKNFDITVTDYNAEYDGKAHSITLTGVPEGASVKFGNVEGTYDQESVTYTDDTEGAKTVYVRVTMYGYNDFTGYGTVTITKPEPTEAPTEVPTQAPTDTPAATPTVAPTQAPENKDDTDTNTGDVTGNQDTKPEEKVTTVTNEDGTAASIPESFIDSIRLTKSEQKAVENGAEIKLEVSADEKKATKTEKKNAQAAVDEIAVILENIGIMADNGTGADSTDGTNTGTGSTGNTTSVPSLTVGPTYNVSMTKQVGDGEKKAVKTNGSEATFTVSVPVSENLLNTDDSMKRLYFMVSTNADDTQNVVPAKLDTETNTLSFEASGNGKVTLVTTDVAYFEEKGTELTTSAKLNAKYSVATPGTKAGQTGEVGYTGPQKKKASLTVKDTVKINGIIYNITSIGEDAFVGNKKLKKLTIGQNITTIGAGAFKGCKNLKEIVINSKLLKAKNLSAAAFEGLREDVVIYVPTKKLKAYTTMFKKLGVKAELKAIK